jgi:hypothetical protein
MILHVPEKASEKLHDYDPIDSVHSIPVINEQEEVNTHFRDLMISFFVTSLPPTRCRFKSSSVSFASASSILFVSALCSSTTASRRSLMV